MPGTRPGMTTDSKENETNRFNLALLSVVAVVCASPIHAQDKYPSKPIKVEVPFGAGQRHRHRHPHRRRPVAPRARPADRGREQAGRLRHPRHRGDGEGAAPDGYTLQVGNPGTNVLTPIIYKDKFKIDYDKEVVMVTRLGEVPLILAATTKDFAPKNYGEFIALCQGQSRQGALRQRRRRQQQPLRHRGVRAVGRPQARFTFRTRAAAPRSPTISFRAMPRWPWSTRRVRPA